MDDCLALGLRGAECCQRKHQPKSRKREWEEREGKTSYRPCAPPVLWGRRHITALSVASMAADIATGSYLCLFGGRWKAHVCRSRAWEVLLPCKRCWQILRCGFFRTPAKLFLPRSIDTIHCGFDGAIVAIPVSYKHLELWTWDFRLLLSRKLEGLHARFAGTPPRGQRCRAPPTLDNINILQKVGEVPYLHVESDI